MQLILDIDKLKIEQKLRLRVLDEIRKYSNWIYFDSPHQLDDVMFTSPTGFEHNLALGTWIPDTKGNVEFFVLHLSSPKIGKEMWRFGFDKDLMFIGWQIFFEGELTENQDLNLDSIPIKGRSIESVLVTVLDHLDEKPKPNMVELVEMYKSKKPRIFGSGMFCSPIEVKS